MDTLGLPIEWQCPKTRARNPSAVVPQGRPSTVVLEDLGGILPFWRISCLPGGILGFLGGILPLWWVSWVALFGGPGEPWGYPLFLGGVSCLPGKYILPFWWCPALLGGVSCLPWGILAFWWGILGFLCLSEGGILPFWGFRALLGCVLPFWVVSCLSGGYPAFLVGNLPCLEGALPLSRWEFMGLP